MQELLPQKYRIEKCLKRVSFKNENAYNVTHLSLNFFTLYTDVNACHYYIFYKHFPCTSELIS